MKPPFGYCDLRVENASDDVVTAFVDHGYNCIALNTTVNCSLLNVGCSNRKKRKIEECYDENVKIDEQKDLVPVPKLTNYTNSKLTIFNRLTIQITNMGHVQTIANSRNFKLYYSILAVEPLNGHILQELVTSPHVDIIVLDVNTTISPKEYLVALNKNIYFELCYGPMLSSSAARQDTIGLAHILHLKGKSKNLIISSGAVKKLDVRNPHDVMNLCILFGLSKQQSKESITRWCHSIILNTYGRKLGKTALNLKLKLN